MTMTNPATDPILTHLRASARALPESGIVRVFNHGRNKPGLIPLWAGEGDLPTPRFITDAASASLSQGETFYTYQRGLPELRQAIADYHTRIYGNAFFFGRVHCHRRRDAGDPTRLSDGVWDG